MRDDDNGVNVKEISGSLKDIEELLDKAAECDTEVTVADVCYCITQFLGGIPGTGMYRDLVKCCGGDAATAHKFIMCIYASIIATVYMNLAEDENNGRA